MYELRHPDLEETITVRTPGQVRAHATAGWELVGEIAEPADESAAQTSAEADTPNPLTED